MKRKIRLLVCVLTACLQTCGFVTDGDDVRAACNSPAGVIYYLGLQDTTQDYYCAGEDATISVTVTGDPTGTQPVYLGWNFNGGLVTGSTSVNFGSPYTITLPASLMTPSTAVGDKTLTIVARNMPDDYFPPDGKPCIASVSRNFTVLKVELDIGTVSDEDEETVGGFVPVNADNDNGSTVTHHIPATRDFDADGYTDDDLVTISLSLQPTTGLSGTLRLRKVESGRDRIKIWETTGKATEVPLPKTWTVGTDAIPATLYVEGLKEGQALRDIDLVLEYLQGGTVLCDDKVKVTVTPVLKTLQASGSGSPWFNAGQSLLFAGTGVGISLSGETYQDGLPSGVLSLIQHLKYGNHLADGAGTLTYSGTKKKADHTDTAYRGMALVDVPASGTLPWYVLADGGTPWAFSTDDNPQLAIVAPQTIGLIDNDPTSKTLVDVSFLFDIYAAWTFPSANPDDRVVYFLGKANWSVRYDGDFKKVNGSVVYTVGAQNAITDSTGFSRQNANQRTEGPTANEQIGDTWVDP